MSESGKYTVLGAMSGTSLDGLDLALCQFQKNENSYNFEILAATTIEYNLTQKNKLKALPYLAVENYFLMHHLFGKFIAREANLFLNKTKIKAQAISSHGHTVFHQPQKGFSTQIGCGATIAAISQLTTVCDFRSMDVALNGQGAPLVPIGDKYLFEKYDACLNLGGIANISFVNPKSERVAFDICYANMALNFFANKEGYQYDSEGKIAKSGSLNQELLSKLNQLEFFKTNGAKSLGREGFEIELLRVIEPFNITNMDILRTLTEHCSEQITNVLNSHSIKSVLVTGGGTFNSYLIENIRAKYSGEMIIPSKEIINFKEALIFAFLGYLRLTNEVNTLKSVTGASRDSIGGAIYYS